MFRLSINWTLCWVRFGVFLSLVNVAIVNVSKLSVGQQAVAATLNRILPSSNLGLGVVIVKQVFGKADRPSASLS